MGRLAIAGTAAALGLGLLTALPAAASGVGSDLTYIDFVGQCAAHDCIGYGLGVLTLQNYTLGTTATLSNFVDFEYSSSVVSLDMTPGDLGDFSATFTTLPGKDALELTGIAESYPEPFGDGSFDFDTILPSSEAPDGLWLLTFFASDSAEKPGGLGNHVEDVGVPFVFFVSNSPDLPTAPMGGAPEPASWALMIAGFGLAGASLRRRRGRAETVT